jgi:hypothetical protein
MDKERAGGEVEDEKIRMRCVKLIPRLTTVWARRVIVKVMME